MAEAADRKVAPELVAYVGMAGDLLHAGHVNILETARRLVGPTGRVIVGLLTDAAIESYKGRRPVLNWEERAAVIRPLRMVNRVVPQATHDYTDNLRQFKPDFVVHGDDWKTGQATVRAKVLAVMEEWGGKVIEPFYTTGISTTDIIARIRSRKG